MSAACASSHAIERVDDLHAVDVGSVRHVFGVEPGDSGVGAGSEQEAVLIRQAETLVEFQGVVEDDGSRSFDREEAANARSLARPKRKRFTQASRAALAPGLFAAITQVRGLTPPGSPTFVGRINFEF